MPFTLAHPAAVLPVNRLLRVFTPRRSALPFWALAAGSMAPDFPYFLPFLPFSHLSHKLTGLFLFCLPYGFIAAWIFHTWIQPALRVLFPASLEIFPTGLLQQGKLRSLVASALAILIGAGTHLLWDSFTHYEGWAVQSIPALQGEALAIGSHSFPLYKLLQHGSSLVGMLLLFIYLRRLPPQQCTPASREKRYGRRLIRLMLAAILLIPLAAATAAGATAASHVQGVQILPVFARQWIVIWLSLLCLLVALMGIGLRLHEYLGARQAGAG